MLCKCGCGGVVKTPGYEFKQGHSSRIVNEVELARREKIGLDSKRRWEDPKYRKTVSKSGQKALADRFERGDYLLVCKSCGISFVFRLPRKNLCQVCSTKPCACGCGLIPASGSYIRGHLPQKSTKKGKTFEEMYGEERAAELKLQTSKTVSSLTLEQRVGDEKAILLRAKWVAEEEERRIFLAKPRPKTYEEKFGEIRAAEIRAKISKSNLGKHTGPREPEVIEKIVDKRAKQKFPFNNTYPEQLTAQKLVALGLVFQTQFRIPTFRRHSYDFCLLDFLVLIEVDGCYWHGCPDHYPERKEQAQQKAEIKYLREAMKAGFRLVRIWEHEILVGDFSKLENVLSRLTEKSDVA